MCKIHKVDNINELDKVFDVVSQYISDDSVLLGFRNMVLYGSKHGSIYTSEDYDIVMIFMIVDEGLCTQHLYKGTKCKTNMFSFGLEASIAFLTEHEEVQEILNVVKKKDRGLRLFMSSLIPFGCKKVSEFDNKDILYSTSRHCYFDLIESKRSEK